jgi:hypothetical protein
VLNGHGEIRAGVKSHQGKIHTKALSAREAENFMQAGKIRQNHLGGRVVLTEVRLLAVVGFMQQRDWAKGRFMVRLSRKATQVTRGRGTEIMQQVRQCHVSGNALIEGGCWMTSVSADPLVIHATARLGQGKHHG